MNSISSAELAQIQSDAAFAALDKPCVIARKTMTRDTVGTESEVYAVNSVTKCGVSEPTAGQLQNYGYVIGSLKAWQVRFPVNTSVQEQDHIIIGSDTLEVQVLMSPRSYMALQIVLASEVK